MVASVVGAAAGCQPRRSESRLRRASPRFGWLCRSEKGHRLAPPVVAEVTRLLTEHEVARSWRNLFNSPDFGEETFRKAERLLEELRPESPLRHRLAQELAELRKIRAQRKKPAARQKVSP